jgi:hypothetical protein
MAQSPQSPVFQFLIQKDNLPAVLEVARHAEEIREYVANRFWNRLEQAIKNHRSAMRASLSWTRKLADTSEREFSLIASPQRLPEKGQGLRYVIETHSDYFGMG